MTYIGLNKIPTKKISLIKVHRDLSFVLNDPGTWATQPFLNILWNKAGGIIDTVTLLRTWHEPTTRQISHTYRIEFLVQGTSSTFPGGYAFPIEKLNELIIEIENELVKELNITKKSFHMVKQHTVSWVKPVL